MPTPLHYLPHCILTLLLLALPTAARNRDVVMPDRLPLQAVEAFNPSVVEALAPDVPDAVAEAIALAVADQRLSAARQQLIATARHYLGCRYGAGRRGPDRFDCSGFTSYVYSREGMTIGRSSRDQYRDGTAVRRNELRPGDLVFFAHGGRADRINHVGMVVDAQESGTFRFIHAARTGITISSSTDPFWVSRYVGARRIMEAK